MMLFLLAAFIVAVGGVVAFATRSAAVVGIIDALWPLRAAVVTV